MGEKKKKKRWENLEAHLHVELFEAVGVLNEARRGIIIHLHTSKAQFLSSAQRPLHALSPFSGDTTCPTNSKKRLTHQSDRNTTKHTHTQHTQRERETERGMWKKLNWAKSRKEDKRKKIWARTSTGRRSIWASSSFSLIFSYSSSVSLFNLYSNCWLIGKVEDIEEEEEIGVWLLV